MSDFLNSHPVHLPARETLFLLDNRICICALFGNISKIMHFYAKLMNRKAQDIFPFLVIHDSCIPYVRTVDSEIIIIYYHQKAI